MLFKKQRKIEQLESRCTELSRKCKGLEDNIRNRDKFIEKQNQDIKQYKTDQEKYESTVDELLDLLIEINKKSSSNNYSNPQIALNKINELVRDYDSNY